MSYTAVLGIDQTDALSHVARLRRMAWLIDGAFRVPGTRFRFGLNAALGLAPWAGDALLGALSLYIVYQGYRLGLPRQKLQRMLVNVAIEIGMGAIPWIGDILDVGFKANLRNIAILERHFGVLDQVDRGMWRRPFAR